MQPIDLVLPAHNEAGSIGHTLKEFHDVVAIHHGIPLRFVVCEDGSTDETVPVLRSLADELPIELISEPVRKGYSRAVVDGFRATTSDLVAFIDSDGQCDPADFVTLHDAIDDADLVMGYRNPRRDTRVRIWMSRAFKLVYSLLFRVPVRDPSCPYLLIKKDALDEILAGRVGVLKQGFWWEFVARAAAAGLVIVEVPVSHRVRTSGTTQVYKPTKVPRIAFEHVVGLFVLRRELRAVRKA